MLWQIVRRRPRGRCTGAVLTLCLGRLVLGGGIEAATGQILLPRPANDTVSLSDYTGRSYLDTMLDGSGINAKIDADALRPVAIVDAVTFFVAIEQFDPKFEQRLLSEFLHGKPDVEAALQSLTGQSFTPASLAALFPRCCRGTLPLRTSASQRRFFRSFSFSRAGQAPSLSSTHRITSITLHMKIPMPAPGGAMACLEQGSF